MPLVYCPSCMEVRNFSQRTDKIEGTPNGHPVALAQCDECGFAVLAYFAARDGQIVHHFPREVLCMTCEAALRRH